MIPNVRLPHTSKHVCTEKVILWINCIFLLQLSVNKYLEHTLYMKFIELLSFFNSLVFIHLLQSQSPPLLSVFTSVSSQFPSYLPSIHFIRYTSVFTSFACYFWRNVFAMVLILWHISSALASLLSWWCQNIAPARSHSEYSCFTTD
jgi:hypothetical protein